MKHLFLVAMVVFLGACQTTGTKVHTGDGVIQRTSPLENDMNSFVFVDHHLNKTRMEQKTLTLNGDTLYAKNTRTHQKIAISVENYGTDISATGYLQVWATVRNHTDHSFVLETNTQFFDANGRPLPTQSGWDLLNISPNSRATFEDMAVRDNAENFIVQIRQRR